MTDQELKDLVASLAISQVESDKRFDERMKKSDEKFDKEMAESRKEFDERMKKSDEKFNKEMAESRKEFDERMKKSDEKFDERMERLDKKIEKLSKEIDKMNQMYGDMGNTRGEDAEDFFYRYFDRKRQLGNMKFDKVKKNIKYDDKISKKGQHDIIMINGKSSVLISVKYKLRQKDVDDIVSREIDNLKIYLKQHGLNHKIYGGVASYIVNKETENYAKSKGLFVITRSGDNTVILNEEGFIGKEF